jgi:hypothetical protein
MLRNTYGKRPNNNFSALYGWGYNGFRSWYDAGYSTPRVGWETANDNQLKQFNSFIGTPNEGRLRESTKPFRYYDIDKYFGAFPGGGVYGGRNIYGDAIFGGLGIGIDFPLFLGFDKGTGYEGVNNWALGPIMSHVPIPVRLDDYTDGVRIGRENWIKIVGGFQECLSIKSSGSKVSSSGNLYGMGAGSYNGGPWFHTSMRYWSCVPEIVDSGSDRYFTDPPVTQSWSTQPYASDSAGHIALEPYGSDHTSSGWVDASISVGLVGNAPYSSYMGVKDGKLYTWGDRPFGKGSHHTSNTKADRTTAMEYKIGRVFVVDSTGEGRATQRQQVISSTQPVFSGVFGGVECAAAIDNDGKMYVVGTPSDNIQGKAKPIGPALFHYPYTVQTSLGNTGFTWFDKTGKITAWIQNGYIFTEGFSSATKKYDTNWGSQLDDSANPDHGSVSANKWTQVYCLSDTFGRVASQRYAILGINEDGEIWIRNPNLTSADHSFSPYKHLISSDHQNKWNRISPTGVKFKKIALCPAHGAGRQFSVFKRPNQHNAQKFAYQILGLTDKGELYSTDNNLNSSVFPHVDPDTFNRFTTYCGFDANGNKDSDYDQWQVQWQEIHIPSGFVKIKPTTDGDNAIWDQKNKFCSHSYGEPIGHPDWNEIEPSPAPSPTSYTWGLTYRTVDGDDKLSFLKVKDRTNNGGEFYDVLSNRLPPILEYSDANIDTSADNPNVTRGLVSDVSNFSLKGALSSVNESPAQDIAFARQLASNEDGTIVAVSIPHFSGASREGIVRVYKYSGSAWGQLGSDITFEDEFGNAVDEPAWDNCLSLSSHTGTDITNNLTLAVGSKWGGSVSRGSIWVYKWDGSSWVTKGWSDFEVTSSTNTHTQTVDLSSDGNYIAVGSTYESVSFQSCGSARTYAWDGSSWNQYGGTIQPPALGQVGNQKFGANVKISDNGDTLAIGAPANVGGAGLPFIAVYKYNPDDYSYWARKNVLQEQEWIDQGNKSNAGYFMDMSKDGKVVVTSNYDNNKPQIYIYTYSSSTEKFSLRSKIVPSTASPGLGRDISISRDGSLIAFGSTDTHNLKGSVYIYRRGVGETSWSEEQIVVNSDIPEFTQSRETKGFGYAISISKDGQTITVATRNREAGSTPESPVYRDGRWLQLEHKLDPNGPPEIQFRHPRRTLSVDRDFLWDGQDAHSYIDGWEDLTTCRWSEAGFNKFWGIR